MYLMAKGQYICSMGLDIDWLDKTFLWHLIFMNCVAFIWLCISLKNHIVGAVYICEEIKDYWNNM